MSLLLLLWLCFSFPILHKCSSLPPRIKSKELLKRNSKSALTELLQQNPESPPLLVERPHEIEILKLISPSPKVKKQRPRTMSTESSFSLPPTPPTTPRTPSKPIKIPYPGKAIVRLNSGNTESVPFTEVADELNSPKKLIPRPPVDDDEEEEEIFKMSPVWKDLTEFNKMPESTATVAKTRRISGDFGFFSIEDDGFGKSIKFYVQERRMHYKQQLADHQSNGSDYDSDFDESKPKKCYSLSESFNFCEGAMSV